MDTMNINDALPSIEFETNKGRHNFDEFKGKNIVLYFYPKDNTPGCTIEAKEFRDMESDFVLANTVIIGVSRDSIASHEKFISKYNLTFLLISDTDSKICELFDVIKEKSMFGKKYMGMERSTFLIDAKGVLRKEWRKVKVTGHVKSVLKAAQAIR